MIVLWEIFFGIFLFIAGANAQFQFFEQMFQGGQQHQQQAPKDVPSDSGWYQQNYDAGMFPSHLHCSVSLTYLFSTLLKLSMSRHTW
jgi:hypothetical protein